MFMMDTQAALGRIRRFKTLLTAQQMRTLKGQILSGDTEGAMRGLDKLIKRALLFGDCDGANTE